tara:strand:- start:538 stop:720 length:183 start_codon:yes stop_codon:yes gene_type:complete
MESGTKPNMISRWKLFLTWVRGTVSHGGSLKAQMAEEPEFQNHKYLFIINLDKQKKMRYT